MRLALRRKVFPNPFVAVTMKRSLPLSSRKLSIHGVRWRRAASRSSAIWLSSASRVQARTKSLLVRGRRSGQLAAGHGLVGMVLRACAYERRRADRGEAGRDGPSVGRQAAVRVADD